MSVMTRAPSASQGIYHAYLFSTLDLQHLASCPRQNKYLRTTDGIHELHSHYPHPFSPFSFPPRWVRWTVMTFVLSLGTEMSPSWCPCPGSRSRSGLNFTLFYIMALSTLVCSLSPLWPICFIFIHHTFLRLFSCQNTISCAISLFKVLSLLWENGENKTWTDLWVSFLIYY